MSLYSVECFPAVWCLVINKVHWLLFRTCQYAVLEGALIPKGTEVVVFAYGVHHNDKVFPDPEKFDPERFAGVSNRSPYAYIPFSAGSRNCIG